MKASFMLFEMFDMVERLCVTDHKLKLKNKECFHYLIQIAGGIQVIENLQNHQDQRIVNRSNEILSKYFYQENDISTEFNF